MNLNKNILIGIVALIVLVGAGGFYLMNQRGQEAEEVETAMVEETAMEEDEAMMAEGEEATEAMMADGDGEVKEFVIEGSPFQFAPNQLTVNEGDTVRVVFRNVEGFHDFVIDEFNASTEQINEGSEDVVEFVADQAGEFEFYCSVGNHRALGMVGTLVVE